MKRLFLLGLIQMVGLCTSTLADGYILFRNRVAGEFDAYIYLDRTNQAFFRASLHLLENGTAERLFPETNFNHGSPTAAYYLFPVVVRVPNKQPGDRVSVRVGVEAPDPDWEGNRRYSVWSSWFEVVLGTKEAPGKLVNMEPVGASIPFPCSNCNFPSGKAELEVKVHGDHLMIYPRGLGGDFSDVRTEYSEDLVNWSILPSYIRDTVVSGRHRYYRIIKLPEAEVY